MDELLIPERRCFSCMDQLNVDWDILVCADCLDIRCDDLVKISETVNIEEFLHAEQDPGSQDQK